MVTEAGLAASAVILCERTKIVVKTTTAPTTAPSDLEALFDLGVLDFLITNVSFWRRVGCPAGLRRTTLPVLLIVQ
jgi:hypothetical protein